MVVKRRGKNIEQFQIIQKTNELTFSCFLIACDIGKNNNNVITGAAQGAMITRLPAGEALLPSEPVMTDSIDPLVVCCYYHRLLW